MASTEHLSVTLSEEQNLALYPDFECAICHSLVWRPLIVVSCSHIFCSRCIESWISTSSASAAAAAAAAVAVAAAAAASNGVPTTSCPVCKTRLTAADLKPLALSNPLAYKILGR